MTVTVEARPEQISSWPMQIGFGRAGSYSYDWIDNFGRKSPERIIPKLQPDQSRGEAFG